MMVCIVLQSFYCWKTLFVW